MSELGSRILAIAAGVTIAVGIALATDAGPVATGLMGFGFCAIAQLIINQRSQR